MKVVITTVVDNTEVETEYTKLKHLHFSPSCNIINERVVIDGFECDIVTDDEIDVSLWAQLQDDEGNLWFNGIITFAEVETPRMVHIIVESEIFLLDKKIMRKRYYNNDAVADCIAYLASNLGVTIITPSDVVTDVKVKGFCEKCNARERLQEILFATGLYLKTSFVEHPTVAAVDTEVTSADIPPEKVYWRPSVSYDDYVTAVKVTAYTYTQTLNPTSDDDWVKWKDDNGDIVKYKYTTNEVTLTNTNVPATAPTHEITIDNIGLIGTANVDDVISLLATYYFKRMHVDFDCINNGEYPIGEMYSVPLEYSNTEDSIESAVGFAESMDFSFGHESKSRVTLGACITVPRLMVKFIYVSAESEVGIGLQLGTRTYHFPDGVEFTVIHPYLAYSGRVGYLYYFRPEEDSYTGTLDGESIEVVVDCYIALRKNQKTGQLDVISVDEVERITESGDYIAEIT